MDITYLGKSGVRISGKNVNVLVDPGSAKIKDEVIILTDPKIKSELSGKGHILIDGAGEYEVKGALVVGVPAGDGAVYRVELDGFRVGVVGNVEAKLSDEQVEELSEADVLIVPGGGELKPSEAAEIISRLEPKYVVPVNYDSLDDFLKEMGVQPQPQPKLKLVSRDLPLETTVTPLEISA